jgi:hypothetical protein
LALGVQLEVVRCVDRNFQIGDATEAVTADRPAGSLAFAQQVSARVSVAFGMVVAVAELHYA